MGISFNHPRIRLRKPGKLANTTYANEIASAVNDSDPPYSTGIEKGAYFAPYSFLAKIWDTGPAGEANYTDERYWCKPQLVKTGLATDSIDTDDDHSLTVDSIITATNPAERASSGAAGSGLHFLSKNTVVRVFAESDAGADAASSPKIRYTIDGPPPTVFPVTTATNAGSGGTCGVACNFTYDIKKIGQTNTIGTALTPEFAPYREPGVTYVSGTKGLAYFNGSTATLWSVNEAFSARTLYYIRYTYSCSGTSLVETTARVSVTCS